MVLWFGWKDQGQHVIGNFPPLFVAAHRPEFPLLPPGIWHTERTLFGIGWQFAIRVGALDGLYPEIEQQSLANIAKAQKETENFTLTAEICYRKFHWMRTDYCDDCERGREL
jgi:hypothetical protein